MKKTLLELLKELALAILPFLFEKLQETLTKQKQENETEKQSSN